MNTYVTMYAGAFVDWVVSLFLYVYVPVVVMGPSRSLMRTPSTLETSRGYWEAWDLCTPETW